MAIVNECICADCGLELVDDGRLFYYDSDLEQTIDYLLLMSTVGWGDTSRIRGKVTETYCSRCDKHIRIYSIREIIGEVENPCRIIEKGIARRISTHLERLNELNEIKKREKYELIQKENHYEVLFPEFESLHFSYSYFPQMTKEEAIEDALKSFHEEIDGELESLTEKYKRAEKALSLVIDERDRPYDDDDALEKISCPECGSKISKNINYTECPRCGGNNLMYSTICYD